MPLDMPLHMLSGVLSGTPASRAPSRCRSQSHLLRLRSPGRRVGRELVDRRCIQESLARGSCVSRLAWPVGSRPVHLPVERSDGVAEGVPEPARRCLQVGAVPTSTEVHPAARWDVSERSERRKFFRFQAGRPPQPQSGRRCRAVSGSAVQPRIEVDPGQAEPLHRCDVYGVSVAKCAALHGVTSASCKTRPSGPCHPSHRSCRGSSSRHTSATIRTNSAGSANDSQPGAA